MSLLRWSSCSSVPPWLCCFVMSADAMASMTFYKISVQKLRFWFLAKAIVFQFLSALFACHWSEYVCAGVPVCSLNSLVGRQMACCVTHRSEFYSWVGRFTPWAEALGVFQYKGAHSVSQLIIRRMISSNCLREICHKCSFTKSLPGAWYILYLNVLASLGILAWVVCLWP